MRRLECSSPRFVLPSCPSRCPPRGEGDWGEKMGQRLSGQVKGVVEEVRGQEKGEGRRCPGRIFRRKPERRGVAGKG